METDCEDRLEAMVNQHNDRINKMTVECKEKVDAAVNEKN